MSQFTPLNFSSHGSLKVLADQFSASLGEHHMIPLHAGEFLLAAADYPIVFAKDGETGQIRAVALVGLKPQQNLFFNGTDWGGAYAPMSSRPAPLVALAKSDQSDELVICIQEGSEYLSEQEGEALFTDSGEQTEFLQAQTQIAAEARLHAEQTDSFISKLLALKLIEANPITVSPAQQASYELTGLYVLSEQRLSELDNEGFLELRDKGYLPAIYAAIASQYRLNNLLALQQQTAPS